MIRLHAVSQINYTIHLVSASHMHYDKGQWEVKGEREREVKWGGSQISIHHPSPK
jgi:kynureninase